MKDDKENEEAEDAFIRGYHDIPSNNKLEKMSDVSLAEMLSVSDEGSTKYLIVQQEMGRRNNSHQGESKKRWNEKPVGTICIGVFIMIIGACALYSIHSYFGLSL